MKKFLFLLLILLPSSVFAASADPRGLTSVWLNQNDQIVYSYSTYSTRNATSYALFYKENVNTPLANHFETPIGNRVGTYYVFGFQLIVNQTILNNASIQGFIRDATGDYFTCEISSMNLTNNTNGGLGSIYSGSFLCDFTNLGAPITAYSYGIQTSFQTNIYSYGTTKLSYGLSPDTVSGPLSDINSSINNVNDSVNKVGDAVNNVNDTLNDSSIDSPSSSTSEWGSMNAQNGTITNLLSLPIQLINAYASGMSSSCTPYNLGNMFGTDLILPCINVSNYIGSTLWTTIDVLFSGFMIFAIAKKFIKIFNDFTNLKDTQVDDLYGGGA